MKNIDPSKPLNDLPLLPPPVEKVETIQILKQESKAAVALAELKGLARELVPSLESAEVERCWSGLRPGSFDGFPYLGRLPGVDNAFVAAGHYRSGLYLSTGTALIMSELIRGDKLSLDPSPFRLERG